MIRHLVAASALALALSSTGHAAGDLTRQDPITVKMTLGTPKGEHRFTPDALNLETGKLYVLRIDNPSPNDYYFHSPGLADAVYSRKVVVLAADGKPMAEVYGPVRRLEVKAGSTVEWWLLPVRTGTFDDLASTATHTAAGMRAKIEIK